MPISSIIAKNNASSLSLSSFRTVEPLPANLAQGTFHLPTSFKQVRNQIHRKLPDTLPDHEANKHEVRYFLYQLLTVEKFGIAKEWPQWVVETCAIWQGTGYDLRALPSNKLELLCPLDAGHAMFEKSEKKTTPYPHPNCRRLIGEIISKTVQKMKAKEEQEQKLKQEWDETQAGGRVRRGLILGREGRFDSLGHKFPSSEFLQYPYTNATPGLPGMMPGMAYSERMANAPLFSMPDWGTHMAIRSEPNLYAASMSGSMYPQLSVSTKPGPVIRSSDTSPNTSSGAGTYSPTGTNLTTRTSPPRSFEELNTKQNAQAQTMGRPMSIASSQPMHLGRTRSSSNLVERVTCPLQRQMAEQQDYFDPGRLKYLQTPSRFSMPCLDERVLRPLSQASLTKENLKRAHMPVHTHANAQVRPMTISLPAIPPRSRPVAPASIVYHVKPYEQKTKYGRSKHEEQLSNAGVSSFARGQHYRAASAPTCYRTAPPPGIPLPHQASSVYSQGTSQHFAEERDQLMNLPNTSVRDVHHTPTPSIRPSPTNGPGPRQVGPNSIYYPRSDIAGPRTNSIAPSMTSARTRKINPSIREQFPVRQKPSVPVLSSFRSTSRPNDSNDTFALEQGAYAAFKAGRSVERAQVVRNEVERMHGMVPSNLVGEGLDPMGPTMRTIGRDGRPALTLVEQIREVEILDGRKQRGVNPFNKRI